MEDAFSIKILMHNTNIKPNLLERKDIQVIENYGCQF